jgi:HSP20 family protein
MADPMTVREKSEASPQESTEPGRVYRPDVDICEMPEGLRLWVDMPGVDDQSIEVTLEEGTLSIEGRVSLTDYDSLIPLYTEYNVGNYRRRFTLASEIDGERIRARMVNGVLELDLPKAEKAKSRRIAVSAG